MLCAGFWCLLASVFGFVVCVGVCVRGFGVLVSECWFFAWVGVCVRVCGVLVSVFGAGFGAFFN